MADDLIDETTACKFIQLVHDRAAAALSHVRRPGVLQLVSIAPDDKGMSVSPFAVGNVDQMVEAALIDARAGRKLFIETPQCADRLSMVSRQPRGCSHLRGGIARADAG
jgi:hypothetical protein